MNTGNQHYKIRIDYADLDGKLVRIWNPGRFCRLSRAYEYIEANKLRIERKGGRMIAYEVWDTYTNKCIEAKTYGGN